MKRLLSLLLTAALLLGMASFAGAENSEEFVVLNWFTKGDRPTDYDLVMEKVNEYLLEKINANVNMNFLQWGDEWDTFMSTQVATNEGGVDIVFTASWDGLISQVLEGYFIPLNGDDDYGNLLEEYGQDIIEKLNPAFLKGNEIDGKLYGISCNKELAASCGYLFNPFLVEKYGFDLSTVKTFADIEPMLEIIKENEPDLRAPFGSAQNGSLSFFGPFVTLADDGAVIGHYRDNRDTKAVNMYATPDWKEIFEVTQRWFEKGYINSDVLTIGETYEADYQGGAYFVIPQSMQPGWPGEMTVGGKASIGVFLADPVIRTDDVGGSMLAIVEGSKNPERAMRFINLLESDEYLINLLVFGLEGIHYDFVDREAGIVQVSDRGEEQYNLRGDAWMFGNQLMNYLSTEEESDKWEKIGKFNDDGRPVLSMGFYYKVPPELQPVQASIRDVRREFNALFTGQLNVEEKLPEFLAALENAGLQQLMDDVQAQFDAWYAEVNP